MLEYYYGEIESPHKTSILVKFLRCLILNILKLKLLSGSKSAKYQKYKKK